MHWEFLPLIYVCICYVSIFKSDLMQQQFWLCTDCTISGDSLIIAPLSIITYFLYMNIQYHISRDKGYKPD